jgi:hypothetical protein
MMEKGNLIFNVVLFLTLSSVCVHAQTQSSIRDHEDVPGLDILGHGYDVFDRYADQNSIKLYPLFDWRNKTKCDIRSFWAPEYVILKNLSSHSQETISGMSGQEYSKKLAAKVGLEADAFFFQGSVENSFKIDTHTTKQNFYVTYMDVTEKWQIQFDDREDQFLSILNPRFKKHLEDENMPPSELFKMYGTHYIFSAKLGGRADFTSRTAITKKMHKEEIETAVSVQYKILKGEATLGAEKSKILEDSNTTTHLYVIGGNSEFAANINNPGQYKDWAAGIAKLPVLVNFVDERSLRPIWSLTENTKRKSELEKAFEELCENHPLPKETLRPIPDTPRITQFSGIYSIQQKSSRRYMDASHSGDHRMVTRGHQRNDSQRWEIKPTGEQDTYTIQQKSSNRYVDASHSGDCRMVTRGQQNDDSQRWEIKPTGEQDTYTIMQKSRRAFADASHSGDHRMVTRKWQGDATQQWIIQPLNEDALDYQDWSYGEDP